MTETIDKAWINLWLPELNPAQRKLLLDKVGTIVEETHDLYPNGEKYYPVSQLQNLNRLEVIDETGRAYVKGDIYGLPVEVELSYQDDGHTLKIFVKAKDPNTNKKGTE